MESVLIYQTLRHPLLINNPNNQEVEEKSWTVTENKKKNQNFNLLKNSQPINFT